MTSFAEKVRLEARRKLIEILAADAGYSANHRILRAALERAAAISQTETEIKNHIAWLEDQGLVRTETVGPLTLAHLTDKGLSVAEGAEIVPGIARARPAI